MNVTTLVATLYCHEARGGARHAVALGGTLRDPVRAPHDVLVSEVSATGFRIPATVALAPGDSITLGLAGIGARATRTAECGERSRLPAGNGREPTARRAAPSARS